MSSKRKQSFSGHILEDLESLDVQLEFSEDEFDIEAGDLLTDLRNPSRSMLGSGGSERTSSYSEDSEPLDYESVSSPGGSSTASGPTYIRPAGFEHHAQEIVAAPKPLQSSSGSRTGPAAGRCGSVLSRHSLGAVGAGSSPVKSSNAGAKKKKGLLNADFGITGKKIEGIAVSSGGNSRSKGRKGEINVFD